MDSLEEKDKLLERYNFPKLRQEEIENTILFKWRYISPLSHGWAW